jgi:hypothetical protein
MLQKGLSHELWQQSLAAMEYLHADLRVGTAHAAAFSGRLDREVRHAVRCGAVPQTSVRWFAADQLLGLSASAGREGLQGEELLHPLCGGILVRLDGSGDTDKGLLKAMRWWKGKTYTHCQASDVQPRWQVQDVRRHE